MGETAKTAASPGGFNWDGLMKMLGGFMKKPENQRMIMDFVRPMTQQFDPRTGKMVGGIGTGMLDGASNLINREEVGKAAQAQALREQLYKKNQMAMLQKLLTGQQPAQTTMPDANGSWTSADWMRIKGMAPPLGGGY